MSKTVGIIIAVVLVAGAVGAAVFVFAAGALFNFAFGGIRGSGNVITENREVGDFDQVSVCCGMQLQLEQGAATTLAIEADDNIVPEIETSVNGDTLVVEYSGSMTNYRPSQPVRILVTMPVVRGVDLSGGSRLNASNIETDRFALSTSGGSRAEIESLSTETLDISTNGGGDTEIDALNAHTLDVSTDGGGDTRIGAGSVDEQTAKVNGGGSYSAGEMESQTAVLDLNGGARATVWVVEEMDVKASGGSNLKYYGNPRITQSTSGGSKIESLGSR